jgi:hypothetical protein
MVTSDCLLDFAVCSQERLVGLDELGYRLTRQREGVHVTVGSDPKSRYRLGQIQHLTVGAQDGRWGNLGEGLCFLGHGAYYTPSRQNSNP